MPKELYLLRHAESAEKQQSETDHDRELTSAGMREAYQVGSYLAKNTFRFDGILTSTAKRAFRTTEIVCDAMKIPTSQIIHVDDFYEASVRTLFQYITTLDDDLKSVLCVAHNPTISYLAEYLTKAAIPSMATSGLTIITFDIKSWKEIAEGNGSLQQYITPSTLPD